MKLHESRSWFIAVEEIFMKYHIQDAYEMFNSPPPPAKLNRKVVVNKHVNRHWKENIKASAMLYYSQIPEL